MDFNQVHKFFFLGIGGIGMSALARYFKYQGKEIFGYDLTSTPLTEELIAEGMSIQFDEDLSSVPSDIDLAIYTPAIPIENDLFIHFQKGQVPFLKRSKVLGLLSEEMFTIAIAGTHGKTSISALTAHLLKSAGLKITALIGGICKNFNSNVIFSDGSEFLLVEADEFDRSFLTLKPNIGVVSSMDADHLDVYESKNKLIDSFKDFAKLIKAEGTFICNSKLKNEFPDAQHALNYGIDKHADIIAENIRIEEGSFVFDFKTHEMNIRDIKISVPGLHYIENATAAMAIGYKLGLNANQIKMGIESFEGVERRFEIRHKGHPVYIDDYAHHPEEIRVTVEAVRMLYPGKRITGVFQPHLYSRTRDFADDFAAALSALDEIILLEIYPAREKPMDGVSSAMILDKIDKPGKRILSKTELLNYLGEFENDVLLTMGAGDIGLLANKIEKIFKKR
jgi:UDP-N-acetylmuramate--alanine ligase